MFGKIGFAAAIAASAMASQASAGTLDLTNGGTGAQASKTFVAADVKAKATAFSIDANGTIKAAKLTSWDMGLGITNPGNDNSHTVDNSGWTDFVVFQFDKAVALGNVSFTTGWHSMNDTDATIGHTAVNWASFGLPWNADLTGVFANQNKSFLNQLNLTASNSIGNGNQIRNVNPGLATGNLWVIAASLNNPDKYKDGFKIKNVGYGMPVVAGGVPEPATWAMLILGMGLTGGVMRRKTRARLAFA